MKRTPWLRKVRSIPPWFVMGGVLLVCGGVIASIVWSAMRVRRQEARCSDLEARQRALLAGRVPATEETSRQLRGTWEALTRRAGDWEARLVGSPSSGLRSVSEESVTERADAFFDLAWFAEEMRATAATANVELLPHEAFGFAEHVEGAPRNEDVGRVERQRERIEGLLRELFAAGPARLDYIRRERPVENPPGSLTRGRSAGAERDYFEPTDALLVRHRWDVDTLAFRMSFVTNGAAPGSEDR